MFRTAEEYAQAFSDYSFCSCGALTIFERAGGNGYSVLKKNRKRFLPGLDLRKLRRLKDSYACNHCGNHFGLDICACGSGMPTTACEEGFPCCGEPSQELLGRTCFKDEGAWC